MVFIYIEKIPPTDIMNLLQLLSLIFLETETQLLCLSFINLWIKKKRPGDLKYVLNICLHPSFPQFYKNLKRNS